MYYPEELVEEIRVKNDIVDVISGYLTLQKKGGNHWACCPFHNEKTPSFSVSGNKQMFHCFGCGVSGNVYTFIMKYENYSFQEAAKMLADRAGVQLPEMEYNEVRGEFKYDFGDEAGYTPLLPMYTLGHSFSPANIHAGGLRYHGAGVIVSQLLKDQLMEAVDIDQLESFEAGTLFARVEGIIPAPESCHAIAATIREAKRCKETGEEKVILFNLSGHGLIDMASYDKFLAGDLQNYSLSADDLSRNLAEIEPLQPEA